MKTVIKGAYYFDRDNNKILIPHFTGEFWIVDCTEFKTVDDLKANYDDKYIESVIDSPIELEGEEYYYAESSPCDVGEWELLSDISNIEHIEEDEDFN